MKIPADIGYKSELLKSSVCFGYPFGTDRYTVSDVFCKQARRS